MADPATISIAVKAAVAVATDKRIWKTISVVIASILTPIILIIVMILSILSAGSDHNKAAIDLSFNGDSIPSAMPTEFASHIRDMSKCFTDLDEAVYEAEAQMEGSTLDNIRIKSVFYSLNFGTENLSLPQSEASTFVDCFITYKDGTSVPASLESAYIKLSLIGITVTDEVKANAQKIYERMVCGGAELFSNMIERGGTVNTVLDTSSYTDLTIKNNLDLVAYAEQAFDAGWGYVWGTYGDILTDSLLNSKLDQYPDSVGSYEKFIRCNWLHRRTTDCVGLIKGYCWLNPYTLKYKYGSNSMPDIDADGMYKNAVVSGSMDTMPDTPGLAVWKPAHIGIYVGNGKVIEAMGTKYGVVRTNLKERGWKAWLELPHISYITKKNVKEEKDEYD